LKYILLDSQSVKTIKHEPKPDENGSYLFEDLDNGDYQVKFTIPEDYVVIG